jgi:hypothetical protein
MRTRLYELFYVDGRARLKMYAVSGSVAFLFGTASMALGSRTEESVFGSLILTVVILAIWTFLYCSRQQKASEPLRIPLALPTRRLAFSVSALLASFLVSLSTESIEAAIINKKLKKYADQPILEDPDLKSLISTLAYVSQNDVKVSSKLLARIGNNVATGTPTPDSHKAAEWVANIQSQVSPVKAEPQQFSSWPGVMMDNYFHGVTFSDASVQLDTNTFEQVLFLRCRVQYRGGPVSLRATTFLRCRFEIADSPQGRALLAELARGSGVDFVFESNRLLQPGGASH